MISFIPLAFSSLVSPTHNMRLTKADIKVQYDGKTVIPTWTTSYVDDACDNRATVIDPSTIRITWKST